MRRVFQAMGTSIIIDVPLTEDQTVFRHVQDWFESVNARFSKYLFDSEVNKWARGELHKTSPQLREIVGACDLACQKTGGYFSANYGGDFDPSGYVKGWAVDGAAKIIARAGYNWFCVNAGGDMSLCGNEKPWRVGIQHPGRSGEILDVIEICNGAIATSGSYERGYHIVDPLTNKVADTWASVTITGPDIKQADVLATAVFAAGYNGPDIMNEFPGYEAVVVDRRFRVLRVGVAKS
jgi:FAD:protein FMN transferase